MPRFACFLLFFTLAAVAATASAESVRFTKAPSQVGDRVEQRIEASMDLELRSTRGTEVLERRRSASGREQHRLVVATQAESGVVTGAVATFFASGKTRDGKAVADPVVGKTYRCAREGETLKITTPEGLTPPLEEFKVVARAMASLGKPNPLADYLSGRMVAVGERLEVPPDVAKGLMGLGDRVGEVDRFALTLRSVAPGSVARFDAEMEASGAGSSQMRMMLAGEMHIEADTCRVVSTRLGGPVGLLETRGGLGNSWRVDGTGQLQIAVESTQSRRVERMTSASAPRR